MHEFTVIYRSGAVAGETDGVCYKYQTLNCRKNKEPYKHISQG